MFNVLFADEPRVRVFGWSSFGFNHRKPTLLLVRILIALTRLRLFPTALTTDSALIAFESNFLVRWGR